jgi:hypothetical protein
MDIRGARATTAQERQDAAQYSATGIAGRTSKLIEETGTDRERERVVGGWGEEAANDERSDSILIVLSVGCDTPQRA